jgi:uncharacterized repeat protein (TIGR01451 family)
MIGLFVILGCKSCVGPQLEFNKTAQPTVFSGAGEVITYSYALTNTSAKFFMYSITDDKLGAVPCGSDRLEAGQSVTCQMTYTTTDADVAAGVIQNTALAKAVFPMQDLDWFIIDESSAELSDSAEVVFAPQCKLTLKKSASPTMYQLAGDVIEYTYTLNSVGPLELHGPFTIADDRVDEWSCDDAGGSLALCESCAPIVCKGSYTVKESDVGSNIVNTATAQGICASDGSTVSSNSATATVLYPMPTATSQAILPTLTIIETLNQTVYSKVGEVIVYTYTVKNSGQVDAQGPFEVVDGLLDQWECGSQTVLPVGGQMTCKGYYRVKTTGSDIVNSSRVKGASATSNVVSDTVYYISTSAIVTEPPAEEPEPPTEEPEPPPGGCEPSWSPGCQ